MRRTRRAAATAVFTAAAMLFTAGGMAGYASEAYKQEEGFYPYYLKEDGVYRCDSGGGVLKIRDAVMEGGEADLYQNLYFLSNSADGRYMIYTGNQGENQQGKELYYRDEQDPGSERAAASGVLEYRPAGGRCILYTTEGRERGEAYHLFDIYREPGRKPAGKRALLSG